MKYKVGDKVRVRKWDDMEKEFGLDNGDIAIPHCYFTFGMKKHCNYVVTISEETERGKYHIKEDNAGWFWCDEMFESNYSITDKMCDDLLNYSYISMKNEVDKLSKWYYGSSIDSYDTDKDSVIILNPEGFYQIKKYLNSNVIMSFYIYSNLETIKKRLNKRGGNKEEAARRITADLVDFKGFENEVDKVIYNNDGTNINEIVDRILSYVNTRKVNRE